MVLQKPFLQRAWNTETCLNKLPITKQYNLLSDTTAQFPDLCFHAAVCCVVFNVKNRSYETQTLYRNYFSETVQYQQRCADRHCYEHTSNSQLSLRHLCPHFRQLQVLLMSKLFFEKKGVLVYWANSIPTIRNIVLLNSVIETGIFCVEVHRKFNVCTK